jgi:hypothetical protein
VAFVRAKTYQSKSYGQRIVYELVENMRASGRVRQRVVAYLGEYPTVEAALAALPDAIERCRAQAATAAAAAVEYLPHVQQEIAFSAWSDTLRGRQTQRRRCTGGPFGQCRKYREARARAEQYERWAVELERRLDRLRALQTARSA